MALISKDLTTENTECTEKIKGDSVFFVSSPGTARDF